MSLNTTVTMSNNNATEKESSNALCRFPDKREREEFPNWLFKVKAFLDAKGLLGMVNKPIPGLPDSVDEQAEHFALGRGHEAVKHVRVFANGQVREQLHVVAGRGQFVKGGERDQHFIADAVDIHSHLRGQRFNEFAVQEINHV